MPILKVVDILLNWFNYLNPYGIGKAIFVFVVILVVKLFIFSEEAEINRNFKVKT